MIGRRFGRAIVKTSPWAIAILLVAPVGSLAAQSQQDQSAPSASQQQESLADAARRIREQKKEHPKPTKVWDNSNLPSDSGISVVGKEGDGTGAPQSQTNANNSAAPAKGDRAAIQAHYDEAKKELESLKTDLDLAQRKYILDDQMFRSEPNFNSDKEGAAGIKDEKDQVDAKHEAVTDAQKKLDNLQAQLDSLGSAPESNPPGGNAPENSK
jgi:hypothetical protein